MSRVRPINIEITARRELLDELWSMIALLENIEEVRLFFSDLLSETESVMLARRIRIARLLLSGATYADIQEYTHAANATIASVEQWLQGGGGGYARALPKLEEELKLKSKIYKKKARSHMPHTLEWMKRKYPLHFLLLNAMDAYKLRTPKRLRDHSSHGRKKRL